MLPLFAGIFTVVFFLYELPVEPVIYSALLCFAVGLTAIVFAFFAFLRKHRVLTGLQKNITVSLDELSEAKGLIEQDYARLIAILHDENRRLKAEYDENRSEMTLYYTMWAHQIKTPISAMRLLIQADRNAQYTELESELFRIEQYVGMVLGFLRADSMSSDLMIGHYSLDDIVRQAVRNYAKEFIRRKIGLDFLPTAYQVLTDEKWLVFVIEQLLSNALKYTKAGKISIYPDESRPMTLVIEDTGVGIGQEDLPRVFECGFTGLNGRTDKRSTGIGLYLCRKIINRLNHTIIIESSVGEGTIIRIGLDHVDLAVE
ncbi:MAG: HAMP domain-containing histidine kinase [Clostridiales bacterium]|jgi:signal transduction histidine kinase|nr:HAMP domain-containing histidine kinase [Clostridiales bacterium]